MGSLDEILDYYPDLFDKREGSNHYNYHQVISSLEDIFQRDALLLDLQLGLNRPLKIWRDQIIPNSYTVRYEVNLHGIRHGVS